MSPTHKPISRKTTPEEKIKKYERVSVGLKDFIQMPFGMPWISVFFLGFYSLIFVLAPIIAIRIILSFFNII
jgi:hypothetical protein